MGRAAMPWSIAAGHAKGYLARMRFRLASWIVALMVVLALSLGSVAQSVMAAEMSPTIAAGSDSIPPEDCDACGSDAAMTDLNCSAACSSSATLASPLLVNRGLVPQFATFVAADQASWRANPDPFPPRSHVLS